MKHIKTTISGLLAGIIIGIGGLIFSCVMAKSQFVGENILAAFLFSIGLLLICAFEFNLYTGKIGFVLDNKSSYIIDLCEMFLGNFIGAILMGFLVRGCSSQYATAINNLKAICEVKYAHPWYTFLLLAFGCGMLVYLAVRIFKSEQHALIRTLGLVLCVTVFVSVGFIHVIAEVFYLIAADKVELKSILYLFLAIVGNSLGSIFLNELIKIVNKTEKSKVEPKN